MTPQVYLRRKFWRFTPLCTEFLRRNDTHTHIPMYSWNYPWVWLFTHRHTHQEKTREYTRYLPTHGYFYMGMQPWLLVRRKVVSPNLTLQFASRSFVVVTSTGPDYWQQCVHLQINLIWTCTSAFTSLKLHGCRLTLFSAFIIAKKYEHRYALNLLLLHLNSRCWRSEQTHNNTLDI